MKNPKKILYAQLAILLCGILTPPANSQIRINEIMASNATTLADKDFGKYCDWIELYNNSNSGLDLSGFYLSDDYTNLSKWSFKAGTIVSAHSYLLVYADGFNIGLHTNFNLAKEGEKIFLLNNKLVLLDSLSFPAQLTDISYGRKPDSPLILGYFKITTPGIVNNSGLAKGISPEPVFSVRGGFHSGPQTIKIKVADQEVSILYTLDGSDPGLSSSVYPDSIVLSETSVLRVKTYKTGFLPGLTVTQSYFIDEPVNLPVISLVTNPEHFFSDETGIYVQGTAGVPGYCTSVPHNVNQDWEKPVNIELFEKDGTQGLNQLAGVKIFGGCSRVRYPMKSLAFYARKEYETITKQIDIDEYINYQVTQIFLGGRDWPGNNIKFWRNSEKPYNRWRWILCDLDFTFKEYFSDIMDEATKLDCGCTWPNPPWSTYLFRRLLENETFRNEFIQKFFLYSETCFSRDRVHDFIDSMQAAIAPEIPRHIERWGGQKTNLPDNTWVEPIFESVEKWESNVQLMRDFTDTRHEMAKKQLMDYFGIERLVGLKTEVEPLNLGVISAANTMIPRSPFTADMISGIPVELSCKPLPGYVLSHWEINQKREIDSILIAKGDAWKYQESWWEPANDWRALNYDDSGWDTENAQFGYGEGDESKVLTYGGDPQNKMITTWFRKKFSIEDKSVFTRYTLHLLRDDGARVYLNGMEVIRDNLDRWWVGSYTTAMQDIDGADENIFQTWFLNPALFYEGENVIAVEVHQSSATSDDMSFDMDLLATYLLEDTTLISYDRNLVLPVSDYTSVTAQIIPEPEPVQNIFINEVMAKNTSGLTDESGEFEDWIELYNGGTDTIELAGLYLSDTIPAINGWRIPEGFPRQTRLGPNGFVVFVADKELFEGLLHADFKLDKDGDEVALLQRIGEDTIIIDQLRFGVQNGNISYGRFPDGSAEFKFMPVNTPWASNFWEPEVVPFTGGTLSTDALSIYPVPTDGELFIKVNVNNNLAGDKLLINIYSGTGRLVYVSGYHTNEIIEISLRNQPNGLYLVRINTGNKVLERRVILL
jgi:hypothetical protein